MMTAGVALSKSTKPTYSKIEFPEILRLMSRQRKANDLRSIIISEIAKKCHMSMRKANTEMFWFLLLMLKNEEFKSKIYKKMGWNEDIQSYLNNLSQNLHIKAS
jgi:hypothetical protein